MTKFFIFVALLFAVTPVEAKSIGLPDLDLRSSLSTSADPLHTEDFATVDPGVVNPHLTNWAVGRVVQLLGLGARVLQQKTFGVNAVALDAKTEIHLRAPGPWYQSLNQFPCGERSYAPGFITEDGAKSLAAEAARAWDALIVERKQKLAGDLAKIAVGTQADALDKGQRVFQEWLGQTDALWRENVINELAPAEWQNEKAAAITDHYCTQKGVAGKDHSAEQSWPDSWMSAAGSESTAAPAPDSSPTPLFRSPARRYEGYYTIHIDLRVGDRTVSGQFVIDPESPWSVVSPSWLVAQGVKPAWVEIPESAPQTVRVKAGQGAKGLARMVTFDQVTTSGFQLPIHRFELFEVASIYDEPEAPQPCCSGVLGQDFLSRYALEFHPLEPLEVIARPMADTIGVSEAFHDGMWVEIRRDKNRDFTVGCSPRVQALNIPKLCQPPHLAIQDSVGNMVMDVPHGKLWYSKREMNVPEFHNLSGLKLEYGYVKQDRALVVKAIGKTPGARALAKAGLKVGDVVSEIDGAPATHMDIWDVERHLAGVYANVVTVKWLARGEYKVAPLNLIMEELKEEGSRKSAPREKISGENA